MSRNLQLYLTDILTCIDKIQRYSAGLTYEVLLADERTFEAIIFNLQIIGEATKQIPTSLRSQYPQVEWRRIAGLRDIIAHTYFSVNPQIIWSILQTKLDPLQACVESMLQQEKSSF